MMAQTSATWAAGKMFNAAEGGVWPHDIIGTVEYWRRWLLGKYSTPPKVAFGATKYMGAAEKSTFGCPKLYGCQSRRRWVLQKVFNATENCFDLFLAPPTAGWRRFEKFIHLKKNVFRTLRHSHAKKIWRRRRLQNH